MRNILLTGLLIFSVIITSAQKSDFGNWLIYFGNGKINDKWSIWTEAQWRSYNIIDDRQQLLLRVAATYNINADVNISQGYGFVAGRNYDASGKATNTSEHRLYQQLLLRQRFNRVYVSHRYRIEERFFKDDFQLRFRYFLSTNVVLNKTKLNKGAIYFSGYNEVFINSDKSVFDRDRLYGGLGYVFNNNIRAEAGVMTQMQETTSRGQFNVMLFHNFNL